MDKKSFPKALYVFREVDGKESYLIANETMAEIPADQDGSLVGVYHLFRESKFTVLKQLA